MSRFVFTGLLYCLVLPVAATAADGNRLAYLDGPLDPYYPHRNFPKLITPQWVGEDGVECVVTLAIDDMRDSAKYEAFLRPILNRLKAIDGRAAVSIMSCRVDPADPQLQAWLKEGLSIEVHTYDHPCPILQDGGLEKAKGTYDKCVDLMNQIPGNKPVAFRVPCCDSKNTPSPRFWAEIFNKTTDKGNFLQIDSSVFNIITNKDQELPKEITELPDGSERFRRYVPFANFVNTIEDYPYPYVIGGMCWEFPCVTPSDWSAQFVQKPNNPDTVRDWKLALDACVIKQGVFNLVFHPHGWIRNDQIVELIDHAVTKHGKKVKFLTFKECAEKLNDQLLIGCPLRWDSGRPLLQGALLHDFDDDGFMDVRLPMSDQRKWLSQEKKWTGSTAADIAAKRRSYLRFENRRGLILQHDIDGDGIAEVIRRKPRTPAGKHEFAVVGAPFSTPSSIQGTNAGEEDSAALRFMDINSDGKLDCLFSNHERYCLYLFKDMKEGWATKVFDVVRGKEDAADLGSKVPVFPPFVRADGTNNGAWFHSGALWLQNEDTWRLPDGVFKLTFAEMLGNQKSEVGGQKSDGGKQGEDCCGAADEVQGPKSQVQSEQPIQNPKSKIQNVAPPSSDARYDDLKMPPPLSPEESLKALHVRPGMKVELVAAEPLIVDPVAFDWGPDGRLWVVEMRDYPSGITWKKEGDEFGKPGGRVKVLTDTDGDGRYDKAALFLDELPFPTGVKVWRKGILVTAAPDILYAEDTDGDDKADVKKTLYRGFGEGNQQHRVNGLRWGLDNWLHVGNGDSGGMIRAMGGLGRSPHAPREKPQAESPSAGKGHISRSEMATEVNVGGRDLRIRPDTGDLEATSGNTQFGRERDDWNNWFGNNNSDPLWHYTLDDHYLRRNPHLAPPPVRKQVSVTPGAAPVYPRSKTLTRFNDDNKANRYTSACGPMLYRDELLGPEFYGNSFVCEPVHNLVSREIVSPQGATFTSKRADDEKTSEFLASEDNWFRPSMARTGPDGAVWVADMYRFVIEHPKWIPLAAQAKLDLRAGDDKGRIYRIYPEGKQPRPIARMDKLDRRDLCLALDSPNGWVRDMAQQMLLWREDKDDVDWVMTARKMSRSPQGRLHALCTLEGMNALLPSLVEESLADPHPGVRRHAVRLAEPFFKTTPALGRRVAALATDADPQVRMQVAYSLGEWSDPLAAQTLAMLLVANAADPYLTAAALSSVNQANVGEVLGKVLAASTASGSGTDKLIERLLSMAAAMEQDRAVGQALTTIMQAQVSTDYAAWQFASLSGVVDTFQRRKVNVTNMLDPNNRRQLEFMLFSARERVQANVAPADHASWLPAAIAAVPLLARGLDDRDDADVKLLATQIAPQRPPELRSAAATALARTGRADVPKLLLAGWSAHSPTLRSQILDALAAREEWSLALLTAVESGQVPQAQLDARRRQQLLTARSPKVRERAEKVLAGAIDANRQKLVETYLSAATANKGEAERGKAAFAKRCANCHKLSGEGHAVGPDLGPLAHRAPEYLLTAILDPNRAVEDRYLEYVALTTDGRQLTGILLEETGASLTLAAPEGKRVVIPRGELEQIKSSGKSLMPEGVERDVPPAEMIDILAYLKSNAPPPKQLALNQPEVVQPFNDGSIRLFATNCRAYGPTIKMEETFRALGWWNSTDDYCAWSFEVPAGGAGEYRVTLEYSCADNSAGNTAVIEVAGQTLTGQVATSGGWDKYRGWNIGTVTLPAGRSELVVRSSGPIKQALFDLGGIRLVPAK